MRLSDKRRGVLNEKYEIRIDNFNDLYDLDEYVYLSPAYKKENERLENVIKLS